MTFRLYTIGSSGKTAEQFFESLKLAGVKRLVDVRLRNNSQLAGFAKRVDLAYLAGALCGISYHHFPSLAPDSEMLDAFKKRNGSWSDFARRFQILMNERGAIPGLDRAFFEHAVCCLLCSEASPEHCHRRLVAEAMKERWPELEIVHL
jgi:uncharacterized protein (DUF488 family)